MKKTSFFESITTKKKKTKTNLWVSSNKCLSNIVLLKFIRLLELADWFCFKMHTFRHTDAQLNKKNYTSVNYVQTLGFNLLSKSTFKASMLISLIQIRK